MTAQVQEPEQVLTDKSETNENVRARTRLSRRLTLMALSRIKQGRITIEDRLGAYSFGDSSGPRAHVVVHDLRAYDRVFRDGGIGLGTGYADGLWATDDLTAFLRVALRNMRRTHKYANAWHRVAAPISDWRADNRPQNLAIDAADVRAHYDLGNEFFELILDETMMYSAAYFQDYGDDLATASRTKLNMLNQLLNLGPDDSVLEVGTGWGGYAEHTAETTRSQVTTTTISHEQFRYASDRINRNQLGKRVTVLDQDYRRLSGKFDKAVSIEMIEAVDWREYDTFFAIINQRLRSGGRLAMQAIVIGNDNFQRTKNKNDFIKEQIFPGGCLPSVQALQSAASRNGLRLTKTTDLGLHYAETLRRWQRNLHEAARTHPDTGPLSDPRFVNLWDFYFSYCEAGFTERYISNKQLLFEKD